MSPFAGRARFRAWRLVGLLGLVRAAALLGGCGPGASASGRDGGAAADDEPALPERKEAPPVPSLAALGPDGRRVTVLVLPGDASVEVDGVSARRRDGVIELVGKVGEVRRLRVFKGTQQMERDVTLQEAGASPPALDLSTRPVSHGVWAEEGKTPAATAAPSVLLPEEFQ